ncbi:extracellular solute-binding protein [Microbacterium esteraromaticum]|uniref:extracellular solute-binding protein n=1 Tax=Microbacterium esteraromaticum TaxID=57043 RepID=UPI001CD6B3B9|nr:extracellular solute-binding protein [Microbacterium esteraromaticum]MCA1305302.1 extracellular solute-binding protein [Microbacterium esteraromaticum]
MHARRTTLIAAAAAAAFTLAGCSAASPSALPAGGEDGGSLVVYAPMDDARIDFVTEQAKEDLGIELTIVGGGGGDLATRLEAEKNNAQADVVVGLGESLLNRLDAQDMFDHYTPAWADLIPEQFRDDDAGFSLFTQTPIVIGYDTAHLGNAEAPDAWLDLAAPEYAEKFVFPATTGQTGQAAIVGILWRYADPETGEVSPEGWDALAAILQNAKQLSDGQQFDWDWVASGELPVVVNWLGGVQIGADDNDLDIAVVDTDGGTPFVSTGVAIVNGTDRAEQAQRFLDWFGSADFQVAYVEATHNDTPLNSDAVARLPEAAAALDSLTKQDIDWSVVTPHLTEWMQKVQLEILG